MIEENELTNEPMMEEEVAGAEQADESMFAEMAPKGRFTKKALNNLVKAANRLLPLFEQEPSYPMFEEDVEVFPTDFVRVLAMFQGAVNAAVDSEMIGEDMDFQMEDIVDDMAVNLIAGKLSSLAKSKDFKNFLKNPPEEEITEEEVEEETAAPTNEELDSLFAGRL
jgi:hypothetical protein